jgi:type I restriction enzyme S subunit
MKRQASMSKRATSLVPRRFKPYPAYKNSGVEWLGEIPAHWEKRKLKRVCRLSYGESLAAGDRLDGDVEVYGSNGPVGTHEHANTRAPCLIIGRKGSFGKVNYCANGVFAIDTTFFVDNRYSDAEIRWLYYALQNAKLDTVSKDSAIPGLDREDAYARDVAACAIPEQRAIAAFLDRETAKIDALVARKERLIELLQEKRTALITRAVTRGLDPNVPMKDSDVEWLGEVPVHWEVKRLKIISTLQTGITLGKTYEVREIETRPYLRVANVQDGYLDLDDIAEIELPTREAYRYELQPSDVLMTEGGDFDKLGRGYVWEGQIPKCLHQNDIFAVRPNNGKLRSEFLSAVLSSGYGRVYFTATSKQSTNLASTNSTKLGNLPLPLPRLSEQEKILQFIGSETGKIDRMKDQAAEGIARLTEFRTALISAAVTGKIDVREEAS